MLLGACGGRVGPPGHPDEPVPATEPRAELTVRVELPATQGCFETFDLAVYADRGIELLAWAPGTRSRCERTLTVRYLPRRLERARVLERLRAHATRVEETPAP